MSISKDYFEMVVLPNIYKIDVYSIGKIFQPKWYPPGNESKIKKPFYTRITELTQGMTHPDYSQQRDVGDCLRYVNQA